VSTAGLSLARLSSGAVVAEELGGKPALGDGEDDQDDESQDQ
jgi:hypothetical protein